MEQLCYSPLEKTVSFYTRNDFAILNHLLAGDHDGLWKYAEIAYRDNQGIVEEYERGERAVRGEEDVKWLNCLKERLIDRLDGPARQKILATARADIANILNTMRPAEENLLLF